MMSRKQRVKFWFEEKWYSIRSFFTLLRRLPGFYRLNWFWDKEPDEYTRILRAYTQVICELTDGRLSKPEYDPVTVLDAIWDRMDKTYGEHPQEE